jgi:hypothetical protein
MDSPGPPWYPIKHVLLGLLYLRDKAVKFSLDFVNGPFIVFGCRRQINGGLAPDVRDPVTIGCVNGSRIRQVGRVFFSNHEKNAVFPEVPSLSNEVESMPVFMLSGS